MAFSPDGAYCRQRRGRCALSAWILQPTVCHGRHNRTGERGLLEPFDRILPHRLLCLYTAAGPTHIASAVHREHRESRVARQERTGIVDLDKLATPIIRGAIHLDRTASLHRGRRERSIRCSIVDNRMASCAHHADGTIPVTIFDCSGNLSAPPASTGELVGGFRNLYVAFQRGTGAVYYDVGSLGRTRGPPA